MKKYDIEQVFRPNSIPWLTYVERDSLVKKVNFVLSDVGSQLLINGPSMSGKTTLLKKCLKEKYNYVYVEIRPGMNILAIIELILEKYKDSLNLPKVKALQKQVRSVDQGMKLLKDYVSEHTMPIVIDDSRESHVKSLATISRIFTSWAGEIENPMMTLIMSGIDVYLDQFIKARGGKEVPRIIFCEVESFSKQELHQILEKGSRCLNIEFTDELKNYIVRFCSGQPRVCQYVASCICREANIQNTQDTKKKIGPEFLADGLNLYEQLDSARLKANIQLAYNYELNARISGDRILQAIDELQTKAGDETIGDHEIPVDNLADYLQLLNKELTKKQLISALKILSSPEGGDVIRFWPDETISFSEPLFRLMIKTIKMNNGKSDKGTNAKLRDALILSLKESS